MGIFELALATAAITMTITRSGLFRPVRDWFDVKLLRCPYCFAHYVAALLVVCTTQGDWSRPMAFNLIVESFAVLCLSVLPMFLIEHFMTLVDRNARIRS